MWLEEFPCPPACALATLSAGLCSGFLHHGYTSRNVRRVRACTRVSSRRTESSGGTDNSAVGKRKKLTNQSCSETFLRITSANQKNSFSSSFRRRKLVFGISQYRSVKNQFSVVLEGEARSNMRGCVTVILKDDEGYFIADLPNISAHQ